MKNFIFLSVLLFAFYGCDIFTDSNDNSNPLHKSILSNEVEFSVEIPNSSYSLFDTLNIAFKVKNISNLPKEFNFANMQQLAFELIDKNKNVAMFYPYIVSPALSRFTVNPGETKVLSISSLLKHHSGNFINKGQYTLSVFLADRNSPKLDLYIFVY